ncbi:Teichuronic acid biosynthesis protein TuaB [Klebsiella pneumoniae]|uniref:lipopolysaccharide biosynthesis protein n=1 Tax=Klebsiella pneumoniae TaxID=573 RepID=UPI000C7E43D9|nr:lipopolysaccharide biosynthesis protein [Klebsiella pneumoniae]HCD1377354.1 lipopolysaccharide biosynthesis protein [Klebsiella pneumoniae subsp. pneumoniae]MBK2705282.1 lipopolysaccharide biosynthesis protein [Klebsiella pneumoniae]MCB7569989.1 lipopolysaccharide biosynthesis protein [Klebsiella pneumoniae]MCB7681484.1 lipopolysaccharide biosynthesis protein [Klebsiella pneumoniae]MCB7692154.1 lipopolysaccharide biosynthesis protein [Klebsiella pneumoniae]
MNLLSNAKWNAFSQFFKICVQLVNVIYLAKIIPPSEYGLMAMALVIINLGMLLRDLGTSSAIIRQKELTNDLINTVFWVNVLMGCIFALLVILGSPVISEIYKQPRLIEVLISMSIIFPLSSSASAHLALLQRESKFKVISFIEIFSSTVSVILALIAAKMGFGVYSLVIQAVSLNLISAIQFWICSKWHPSFSKIIVYHELKKIFGFSANVSLFNIINYFARNADSFIIGRYMSIVVLGSYNLAYRIMLFPLQSLTFVATRSLYPVLSHHQDDNKKIASIYLNCTFFVLFLSAPLMSGIAVLSVPFVNWVFGPQWHITANILTWLAPIGIMQSVLSTTGSVFMAKNKTRTLLYLGIFGTLLQLTSFIIGAKLDIVSFVKLYFIANVINFFPAMYFVFKILDSSIVVFLKKILPIILSTLLMVSAIYIYLQSLVARSDVFIVLTSTCIGVVVYFLASFFSSSDIRELIIKKISKKQHQSF